MRLLLAFAFIFLFSTAQAANEITNNSTAVYPIGLLPKNSKITLQPANLRKTYFTTTSDAIPSFEPLATNSLYQVQSVTNTSLTTSDAANLQALAAQNALVLQQMDLVAAQCQTATTTTSCTLGSDVTAYKAGGFDFQSFFSNLAGTATSNRSRQLKEPSSESDIGVVEKMNETIEKANSKTSANGKDITKDCEEEGSPLPESLGNDKNIQCGVQQALEAYKANKNQIQQDVIIFNDFSDGSKMGKMWFIKTDGSKAQVLDKNPIQVSRGVGGFGEGSGSLKTPNGAILTKSFHPPRAGNIKDGIELVGLEASNSDIHSRGVLLHGWDPYSTTEGCLGVSGQINTGTKGVRSLGSPPPYLDQLKKGILKDGGVLIYNFTPAKKALCKS